MKWIKERKNHWKSENGMATVSILKRSGGWFVCGAWKAGENSWVPGLMSKVVDYPKAVKLAKELRDIAEDVLLKKKLEEDS